MFSLCSFMLACPPFSYLTWEIATKSFTDKVFSDPDVSTVDFFASIQERLVSTGIVHASICLGCVVWPCRVATCIFN